MVIFVTFKRSLEVGGHYIVFRQASFSKKNAHTIIRVTLRHRVAHNSHVRETQDLYRPRRIG